jgi:hypothetical protein
MAVIAPDRVSFSIPVVKSAPGSDGYLRVYGACTSGSVDRDLERVDMQAARRWLETWLATGGNVRLAHDALRPVGKGVGLDFKPEGAYLTSIVVDPLAAEMVRAGVLTAYSIGVSRPGFRADPTGKAARVITDNPAGGTEVSEVSLVDRPSNADCDITISRKVARRVDKFITKAASGKPRKPAGKALKAAGYPGVTKAALRAAQNRESAVRALLVADLDSPDPATRETARAILRDGLS